MVFPVETEDRMLRNLIMLTQDNTRLTVEALRKTLAIMDSLVNEDIDFDIKKLKDVEDVLKEAENLKSTLIREIHNIGGVLINREDFFRLISTLSDIMDHTEVIAIRLTKIGEYRWEIPNGVSEGFKKMSDIAFKAVSQLRDAVMSLGFDSEKSLKFTQQIDETERKLDMLYVEVDFKIITSEAPLPIVLILRDVAALLESMVDYVRTASDLIRMIGH
jgi:hypothetical protein